MARCAHPSCTCTHDASRMVEREGRYYCSEYCIRPADPRQCRCGHPECRTVPGPVQVEEPD